MIPYSDLKETKEMFNNLSIWDKQSLLDEFNPCVVKEERKYVLADCRSNVNGYWNDTKIEYPVIVLQVMVFGDEQCLIEFVYKEYLEQVEEIKE